MARTYRRDGNGRFAGGGSAGGRRAVRQKAGTSVTSVRLKRNPISGTAKPAGTISGSRFGRSVDQFSRETAAALGRSIKPMVRRQSPTLRQQARAAGLRQVNPRTTSRRVLTERSFMTSAPRGTLPKQDPGLAVTGKPGGRKLTGYDTKRRPRRSKATAARAAAAKPQRQARKRQYLWPEKQTTIRRPR